MNYLRNIFKDKKNMINVILMFVIGVMLLVISSGIFSVQEGILPADTGETAVRNREAYEAELERRLEEALGKAAGVGKVKAMITISTGRELVVAEDVTADENLTKEVDAEGGTRETTTKKTDSKHIIMNGGSADEPLVLKQVEPKVEGVVIIAEGGDNIFVKDALVRTAQALFAIEANKVTVLKMKEDQ